MRGFVSGVIWGGVVATLGLAVASQLAPMRPDRVANTQPVVDAAPMPAAAPESASQPATEPVVVEPAAEPVKEPEPAPATVATAPAPVEPVAPSALADAPPAPAAPETADEAPPTAPGSDAAPLAPAPARPAPADADAAPASTEPPPVPPLTPEEEAALAEAALAEGGRMAEPAAEPVAEPVPPAEPLAEMAEPESLLDAPEPPAPGFDKAVEGVTTGRLPAIGDAPEPAATPEITIADPADLPPVQRYAAPFDGAAGKPLFAILLIDAGGPDVDRATLAALPFPVTFALDPTAPDAGQLAAIYRAAGKEVVMLASGIPAGATASDLQVTFESHARALPEAVAVLDLVEGGFQNDRPLATQVVPVIKDQGRGLVTWDQGLNAGDQVARREEVPAGLIFRKLDAEGEGAPIMRRYLDRAAFKAAQDGRVMVAGDARPETVAAILEWTVEGRAGTVTLAPLTAVLTTPE